MIKLVYGSKTTKPDLQYVPVFIERDSIHISEDPGICTFGSETRLGWPVFLMKDKYYPEPDRFGTEPTSTTHAKEPVDADELLDYVYDVVERACRRKFGSAAEENTYNLKNIAINVPYIIDDNGVPYIDEDDDEKNYTASIIKYGITPIEPIR